MADERSRQIYRDLIAYKLTGKIKYLASTVCSRQEVFSSLLRLGPAESYVDLGAYNGDTIEEFLRYTGGRFSAVCAMEPDPKTTRNFVGGPKAWAFFPAIGYGCSILPLGMTGRN